MKSKMTAMCPALSQTLKHFLVNLLKNVAKKDGVMVEEACARMKYSKLVLILKFFEKRAFPN